MAKPKEESQEDKVLAMVSSMTQGDPAMLAELLKIGAELQDNNQS